MKSSHINDKLLFPTLFPNVYFLIFCDLFSISSVVGAVWCSYYNSLKPYTGYRYEFSFSDNWKA